MNKNLVGFTKLKNDVEAVNLVRFVLKKEHRQKIKDLRKQIKEWEEITDDYIRFFSDRGWCIYDSMNIDVAREAVSVAKENGVDEGEKIILNFYTGEVRDVLHWLKNKAKPYADRYDLLSMAFEDHFAGRYYASVPLFLIIVDGVVNDYTKSKGFFAEGTDVTAWDCLVGCDDSITKMKQIFNQKRTRTNTEEIFMPYRNGILHGRDVNYGNTYVSCKCVALMFAVADWIKKCDSEESRKEQFEKESNPPSIRETLSKLSKLEDDKKKIKAWKRRTVEVGVDISKNPTKEECTNYPYMISIIEAFDAWSKKNYGKLSDSFADLFMYEESVRKRAGECRELFANKELLSYSILEVEERACSLTRVLVEVRWNESQKEVVSKMEFGIVYEADDGGIGIPGSDKGRWKLKIWKSGCLYG